MRLLKSAHGAIPLPDLPAASLRSARAGFGLELSESGQSLGGNDRPARPVHDDSYSNYTQRRPDHIGHVGTMAVD